MFVILFPFLPLCVCVYKGHVCAFPFQKVFCLTRKILHFFVCICIENLHKK